MTAARFALLEMDYRARGPINEWSLAAAFGQVREIAEDALNPGVREARIRADEAVRAAARRKVGTLRREERYFLADTRPGSGAWVRFLNGDGKVDGIAHVKVLEVVGDPINVIMRRRGARLEVRADYLQAAPGQPLEVPR